MTAAEHSEHSSTHTAAHRQQAAPGDVGCSPGGAILHCAQQFRSRKRGRLTSVMRLCKCCLDGPPVSGAQEDSALSWPDTKALVTAEFLSDVFGKTVSSFEIEPLGIGFIADAFK
eukprot:COSAG01_NODE_31742_length_592_cov_0.841785_1_plen_114_part_01